MKFSNNLKNVLFVMLTIVLVALLFTGCTKEGDNVVNNLKNELGKENNILDNTGQSSDKAKDDVDPLSKNTINIATLPEFDIEEDKVVTVIAWWVSPKVGDPDINLWPQTDRLLKQLYDLDVEYIKMPAAEVPTKHTAMVMSGDPADVVNLQNWCDYPYSFTKGLYEPLDDILPLDHEVFAPVKKFIDELRVNGKAYWAVNIVRPSPPNFIYNRTLIEGAGLEDPWELVKRNEWTWDKFFDYCKELTVDKDGDGNADQYGAAAIGAFVSNMPNTLGYPISKMGENNEIEINLRDEGLMAYYEFLKKIGPFGEGVFHPLSFKSGDAQIKLQEEFLNGNIGFYYGWGNGGNLGDPLRQMFAKGQIGETILPRYPGADQQYVNVAIGGLGISKGAKHPQAAAAYITTNIACGFQTAAEVKEDSKRLDENKQNELGVDLLSLYKGEYELSFMDIYYALYVNELPVNSLNDVGRAIYLQSYYAKEFPERCIFDFGQFAGLVNYSDFIPVFSGDENGNLVTAQQIIERIEPQMQERIDNFEKAMNGEQ